MDPHTLQLSWLEGWYIDCVVQQRSIQGHYGQGSQTPTTFREVEVFKQIGWSLWFHVHSYLQGVTLPPWWIKNTKGSMVEYRITICKARWVERPHFGEWIDFSLNQEFQNHPTILLQFQVFGHAVQKVWNWQEVWAIGALHSEQAWPIIFNIHVYLPLHETKNPKLFNYLTRCIH